MTNRLIINQAVGYFAFIVTIVALGLLGEFFAEWLTGEKTGLAEDFVIYFVAVLTALGVRSRIVLFFKKSELQRPQHQNNARVEKTERLLESFWFTLSMTLVCGAIAGALVAILD